MSLILSCKCWVGVYFRVKGFDGRYGFFMVYLMGEDCFDYCINNVKIRGERKKIEKVNIVGYGGEIMGRKRVDVKY